MNLAKHTFYKTKSTVQMTVIGPTTNYTPEGYPEKTKPGCFLMEVVPHNESKVRKWAEALNFALNAQESYILVRDITKKTKLKNEGETLVKFIHSNQTTKQSKQFSIALAKRSEREVKENPYGFKYFVNINAGEERQNGMLQVDEMGFLMSLLDDYRAKLVAIDVPQSK